MVMFLAPLSFRPILCQLIFYCLQAFAVCRHNIMRGLNGFGAPFIPLYFSRFSTYCLYSVEQNVPGDLNVLSPLSIFFLSFCF